MIVEAGEQAVDAERPAARRSQLDGEGHALEAPADLGHQRRVGVAGCRARGTVEEELLGLAGVAVVRSTGQPECRDRQHPLARDAEALPAGRQHDRGRARGEEADDERGHRSEHVLAVVEHEEGAADPHPFVHQPLERLLGALDHVEGGGHGLDDQLRAHRHQIDEGAPAGERRRGRRGRDGGEPGLAHATGSEQGDEPIGCQGVGEAGQLGVAADERRPRAGQPRDPGRRGGRGRRLLRHRRQLAPIGRAELAQQRRHVALDRPHRDVQLLPDLGVGQVVAERGQHLCLTGRHLSREHGRHGPIFAENPWSLRGRSVVAPDVCSGRRAHAAVINRSLLWRTR